MDHEPILPKIESQEYFDKDMKCVQCGKRLEFVEDKQSPTIRRRQGVLTPMQLEHVRLN